MFCIVLFWEIGDRLVRAEESVETSHSTIPFVFSGSFAVKRIETVAVHVTIGTERNGDSWRTCANDEHVARTTAGLESRDLEVDNCKLTSSDRLAHEDWRRLRLQLDKQFRQRFPMRTTIEWTTKSGRHPMSWDTSDVQWRICEIHRVAQENREGF